MNGFADEAQERQRLITFLQEQQVKVTKLTSQLAQQTSLEAAASKALLQNITQGLASFRKGVRELELWTEEAGTDDPESFVSLRDQQQAYAALQQAHRAASAQVQQNAAQHLREQRKALLGSPDPSAKQKQMHDSGQVLGVSKDITQGLRRTKQLLSQELDHTSATLAAMDASHERLAKSKEEYEKQTPLLTRSRRLLSKMSWHSLLESLILYGALAFFFLVVAFIIQKRLRYFVPSFLVPSFGKPHSKVPGQYPAGLQQGGLESPGRFADPSGSGSPSNDKWYEAQPGYDLPGDVNDDQWLSEPTQGQPGDSISEASALHEDLTDADALEARETAEAAGLGSGVDDVNAANGTTASGTGSNLTAAKMTDAINTRSSVGNNLHSGESDNVTEMSESQALHTEALSVYSSANGTFTDAALPEDSLRSPYDASAEEEPDWWGLEDQGVTDYTGVGEISFNTSSFKVASAGSADSLAGLNDAALLNGGLLGQEQSHLEASSDLSTVQASDLNASQQHQRVSAENKSALGKPSKLASLQGLASGAFDSVVHSAAFRSLSGAVNRSKPDPIKDPEDSVTRISDILDAAEEDEGDLDVEPDHDEL
ncbi:hypothetical protein WJX84_012275 [Apatococcus fuscideae]|uniref:Sec20 C-terminal domain-containing protein n=1 Tax=Apatococcus fuscideae TaxID=2026836 RepID=A0AAW1T7N1_9CHLO